MSEHEYAPVVCVGFGPAGVGLAAALTDLADANPDAAATARNSVYLDRRREFAWQPELMLAGTDIQHHYLRDFGTPRGPNTRFGFVDYLHAKNRFYEFTQRSGYPERIEWDDYSRWVADHVSGRKYFGVSVVGIEFEDSEVEPRSLYRVVYRGDEGGPLQCFRTPALVIATGYESHLPKVLDVGHPAVLHSSSYLSTIDELADPASIAVVGSAQTAGEVILDLRSRYPKADIHAIMRNNGFSMYDLGHFVNRAYWPSEKDAFTGYPPEARRDIYAEQARTNYAAVDPDVSTALYNDWYRGTITGEQHLHLHIRSVVSKVETRSTILADAPLSLTVTDRFDEQRQTTLAVDAVVAATGYRQPSVPAILDPIADVFARDSRNDLVVDHSGLVARNDGHPSGLYLHGVAERQHGIGSAASFSLLAVRSGEIATAIHTDVTLPFLTSL